MARQLDNAVKKRPSPGFIAGILVFFLRCLIFFYRYSLSFFLGGRCRFIPTCSVYADQALALHGPFKGSWLALRRIIRCHPWGGTGYDPVPGDKTDGKGVGSSPND